MASRGVGGFADTLRAVGESTRTQVQAQIQSRKEENAKAQESANSAAEVEVTQPCSLLTVKAPQLHLTELQAKLVAAELRIRHLEDELTTQAPHLLELPTT